MNHEKFIASLNLYLDGELPAAEAAALERELESNPERRRIYRQYCQMQQACAALAERFREEAAPAPHFRQGRVVELPGASRGEWWRSLALVAGGAAAACAVFVVVSHLKVPAAGTAVATAATRPAAVAATVVGPTTTVAFEPSSAGFGNPWARSTPVALRLDWQPGVLPGSTWLTPPEVRLRGLPQAAPTEGQGAAAGTAPAEAAAFEFQR